MHVDISPDLLGPDRLLRKTEAAVVLRLCDADACPDDLASGQRAVQRLVELGRLRAVRPGRENLIPLSELMRFSREDGTRET